MTLPQIDTVQLACSRHQFKLAPLDWTDRKTQIRGIQTYSPLLCNFWRELAAGIALLMDAVTIDATRLEVAQRFLLAKIAIY